MSIRQRRTSWIGSSPVGLHACFFAPQKLKRGGLNMIIYPLRHRFLLSQRLLGRCNTILVAKGLSHHREGFISRNFEMFEGKISEGILQDFIRGGDYVPGPLDFRPNPKPHPSEENAPL